MKRSHRFRLGRWAQGVALMAVALFVASACSASDGSGTSGVGLPARIKVLSIRDLTGTLSYAGVPTVNGSKLAFKEVNDTKFLGSTKLELEVKDAATNAQTAASLMSTAMASREYAAVLGPFNSAESLVVAPMAEKAHLPVIFTQSNVDGVLLGKYTYRATTPLFAYFGTAGEYLKSKNVKTMSVLYNAGVSSMVRLNDVIRHDFESGYGIKILSSTSVQTTTQDFSGPAAKIAAEKPDAVAVLLVGPSNATAIQQLRQAGFGGQFVATNGAGAGNLTGAGADGAGTVWPTTFQADEQQPVAKKFVAAYRAAYGKTPDNFAADGYDAAWLLARAIKEAGSADPVAVAKGLAATTKLGFDGAAGKLKFDGNDLRSAPVLVQWDGTKEVLLPTPSAG